MWVHKYWWPTAEEPLVVGDAWKPMLSPVRWTDEWLNTLGPAHNREVKLVITEICSSSIIQFQREDKKPILNFPDILNINDHPTRFHWQFHNGYLEFHKWVEDPKPELYSKPRLYYVE